MLAIAEEVLLLVLDDDTGKLSASLPVHALRNAVAGALLMDLALSDRIDTDLHKLILIVRHQNIWDIWACFLTEALAHSG